MQIFLLMLFSELLMRKQVPFDIIIIFNSSLSLDKTSYTAMGQRH